MTADIPAKQSLGQNWLVNEGVLDRIVEAADLTKEDVVLEVGPGKGALTKRLADHAQKVIAIEKDHRLIEELGTLFGSDSHINIIEGDVLEFQPAEFDLKEQDWKLVANLPYYITSHFLRLVLESWPTPKTAVLLVQYEVAKRILAEPPDMNLLALSVRLFADVEQIMRVSRGSFRPIPTVDSAVIKLRPKPLSSEEKEEAQRILSLAKKAFGQKRKQLKATLSEEALRAADIEPQTRPQELSIHDWKRLVPHAF